MPVPADASAATNRGPSRLARLVKLLGIAIALLAVALCAVTLARAWSEISHSIAHARVGWLVLGLVLAAGAMTGLGVLWWRCLSLFGHPVRLVDAVAWYFGGELGKYVPGGVWPVLGRGELANRAGIARTTGYVTTLISYAAMCIGSALVCGVLAPIVAADGQGLGYGWLMLLLIPIGLAALHPAVLGRLLTLGAKLTKGRVSIEPKPWRQMVGLTLWSCATWALVGATSVAVTEALGYSQQPARVAFAAVAAWIIGFLAIPVPAGAGLRELIFLAVSGLDHGPAVAVAAIARVLFIVVDGVGGAAGLAAARRGRNDLLESEQGAH
ncbi:MAG TPA: lysylphosphatidylglycerol synthase domain-containing protein [Jatrophihabitans sp.]|nr:lysylphosphatidylglycerol synthase domain-containing protein [Jatrophihabitans sp.]